MDGKCGSRGPRPVPSPKLDRRGKSPEITAVEGPGTMTGASPGTMLGTTEVKETLLDSTPVT